MTARRLVKAVVFAVCLLVVTPLIVLVWLEKRVFRGEQVFTFCAQLLAPLPGAPGSFLRGAYYFGTLESCSWEAHVGFGSIFTHRGCSMGPRASMGSYCVIGHAHIRAEVMIGSRVSIPSGKRQHIDDDGNLTSNTQYQTITVGERTWVGEGAIVMANIGVGCIVSAGAVVIKDVPANALVGGNPARVVKELVR
jgi:virginiamycin A acetyltransferase